jgi:hypothetical protein
MGKGKKEGVKMKLEKREYWEYWEYWEYVQKRKLDPRWVLTS